MSVLGNLLRVVADKAAGVYKASKERTSSASSGTTKTSSSGTSGTTTVSSGGINYKPPTTSPTPTKPKPSVSNPSSPSGSYGGSNNIYVADNYKPSSGSTLKPGSVVTPQQYQQATSTANKTSTAPKISYTATNTASSSPKITTGQSNINANNNNILSPLASFFNKPKNNANAEKKSTDKSPNLGQPKASTDWTKFNWSKDYGTFLNSIQGDRAKLEAERARTLEKMKQSGGGNKDQIAHLGRLDSMLGTSSGSYVSGNANGYTGGSTSPRPVQMGTTQSTDLASILANLNKSITSQDGRTVNRTTRNTNVVDLNQFANKPLGWRDTSNSRLNLSYLPEGMALPEDGKFTVGAHAILGPDGNALKDKNGNTMFEYRPHIYYDKDGNPSYTNKNDIVVTKGGRTDFNSEAYGLDNQYGYDQQEVRGQEEQMVEMKHPVTGQWQKMSKGSAEAIWRHYVEGGYYSQADKANNIKVVPGEYAKSSDLANSYIHSDNQQKLAEFNNKMYSDNPEQAMLFRAKQEDDYLRSEHFKKTGEQLPPDYFLEEIQQRQKTQQDKLNQFLDSLKKGAGSISGGNGSNANQQAQLVNSINSGNVPVTANTPIAQGTREAAASAPTNINNNASVGAIDWTKFNWSKDYGDYLNSIQNNPNAIQAEIQKTQDKIKSMGSSAGDAQKKHLERLNHMLNLNNIAQGSYNPSEGLTSKTNTQTTAKVTNDAIAKAQEYIGTPYKWGGSSTSGFDCSGLVQNVFGKLGIKLPRTAAAQAKEGVSVDLNNIQPGDLVFFKNTDNRNGITHVGIYQGDGKFIGAQTKGVGTQDLNSNYWSSRLADIRRVGDTNSSQGSTVTPQSQTQSYASATDASGNVDWTKFNWSKDYGNFLNSIQGNPSAINAEIQKTIDKMGNLGSKVGQDQYKHLERLYYMQKQAGGSNNTSGQDVYSNFQNLSPVVQQQITNPNQELVDMLMDQIQQGNSQLDKLYEDYMDLANNMQMPEIAKLTWDEAVKRASAQLDPLYAEKLQATMDAVDQDLIARGFFGQVPGAVVQRSSAAKIATEKAGQTANLAQELVNRSADEANQILQSQLQYQQQQLNNYLQGINLYSQNASSKKNDLMSMLNYYTQQQQYADTRSDAAWNKTIQAAELKLREQDMLLKEGSLTLQQQQFLADATGYINGEPTMAAKKIMQDLGMKEAEINLKMQQAQDKINQEWTKIAISEGNLNLNTEKYNLESSKYYTTIIKNATEYATKRFTIEGWPNILELQPERQQEASIIYNKYFQEGIVMFSGKSAGADLGGSTTTKASGRASEY